MKKAVTYSFEVLKKLSTKLRPTQVDQEKLKKTWGPNPEWAYKVLRRATVHENLTQYR